MKTTLPISVRDLGIADLPEIVAVHKAAFRTSAITRVGPEAVRRYYAWLLEGPHDTYAIGAFRDSELVGFCFGGHYRGALSGYLRKNRAYLAARVALRPWLLFDSFFLSRIASGIMALKKFGWRRARPTVVAAPSSFAILSIATHPRAQGGGIGRALLAQAEDEAIRRHFTKMHLTVAVNNDDAIAFYERLGWQKVAESGAWSGQMSKSVVAVD